MTRFENGPDWLNTRPCPKLRLWSDAHFTALWEYKGKKSPAWRDRGGLTGLQHACHYGEITNLVTKLFEVFVNGAAQLFADLLDGVWIFRAQ
jgi:hypothetical protein